LVHDDYDLHKFCELDSLTVQTINLYS